MPTSPLKNQPSRFETRVTKEVNSQTWDAQPVSNILLRQVTTHSGSLLKSCPSVANYPIVILSCREQSTEWIDLSNITCLCQVTTHSRTLLKSWRSVQITQSWFYRVGSKHIMYLSDSIRPPFLVAQIWEQRQSDMGQGVYLSSKKNPAIKPTGSHHLGLLMKQVYSEIHDYVFCYSWRSTSSICNYETRSLNRSAHVCAVSDRSVSANYQSIFPKCNGNQDHPGMGSAYIMRSVHTDNVSSPQAHEM
ncbi:hypothetical protein DFJ77DRAFT_236032 [Powellomyces hirtus]|nr:hypothetical protein DFJ77DRAFT_236032 [Powellomyces hirtus]